jgi:uncharacterized membrane protein YtjA (UPF0391 family)
MKATLLIIKNQERSNTMLGWALTFLILAFVAAAFGFWPIAGGAYTIAKVLFFVFLVLLVVSLISGYAWRRPLP